MVPRLKSTYRRMRKGVLRAKNSLKQYRDGYVCFWATTLEDDVERKAFIHYMENNLPLGVVLSVDKNVVTIRDVRY